MNVKDLLAKAKETVNAAESIKKQLLAIDADLEAGQKALSMVEKAMDEVKGKDTEAYARGLVLKAQVEGEIATLIATRKTIDPHSASNLKEKMGNHLTKVGQNVIVGSAKTGAVLGALASPANALINSFKQSNAIVTTVMLNNASTEKKSEITL
jgi:hypothetical protein